MKHAGDVTGLLQAWTRGDPDPLAELASLVHYKLRQMAKRMLAGERAASVYGARCASLRFSSCRRRMATIVGESSETDDVGRRTAADASGLHLSITLDISSDHRLS